MIQIEIKDNNVGQVFASLVTTKKLIKETSIRAKNAFWAQSYRNRTWDGFVKYVRPTGTFDLGYLGTVCRTLDKMGKKYKITDNRKPLKWKGIPEKIGKLTPRHYQIESALSVAQNKIKDTPFPRGLLHEATNAGKNLIAAMLYVGYGKPPTIFIVNRVHIYHQAIQELSELFPGEIGHIGPTNGKENRGIKWNNFMVCMIQSMGKLDRQELYQFLLGIVDECHYASTYKFVVAKLNNAYVKVGMSGTIGKHKDKNKDAKIIAYFGDVLHKVSNKDLVDWGYSTKPVIAVVKGNTTVKIPGNYKAEETHGVIFNKERNKKFIKRLHYHAEKGRLPALVICKYHNHTEYIYKKVKTNFPELRVDYIHVKVKDRLERLQKFKDGETDILVSSLLIKEGKNLPLIKYLSYLAGGDSMITLLQILGRLLRKHKSKKKVYMDDFWDIGYYLLRHSKHRLKELKAQQLKVIEKYK